MASRRTSTVPRSFKSSSADNKSSKSGNVTSKANNSGNENKVVKSSGTVVKSRYLQSAEKTALSKSNSSNNESMVPSQRPASPKPRSKVGTPPRRSVAPQALATSIMAKENEPSILEKYVMQSTFSDGHCLRPDFDISVIKEINPSENFTEPERNPVPENDKRIIEMQTLLLAYLTAKMESNTAKLQVEAETRILQELEEEEALRIEVLDKKRQYDLKEKNRLLNELLDVQIASLTPIAEAATQFTEEYKSFAAAVDSTRHELPVKNFYMNRERRDFLDKAESSLKESEKLFEECTDGHTQDNCTSLQFLKSMKTTSKDIGQQLTGAFSELLELSSLICQQTIHLQQAAEEEQLGAARTHKLFCLK
ncbi:HAUS augmin-like complex subunit 8 [Periophthalmus magnuspinnatus]|uniref:HAUS augmin-like complex subunit 8 n=1 Tax=Periophthalmus magnuspinnatus TaxID=409849 RepID=UPI00145C0C6F|nr:HAUS augmin-like complex subunit 8 [Periophthalmus magnuspinnatus]